MKRSQQQIKPVKSAAIRIAFRSGAALFLLLALLHWMQPVSAAEKDDGSPQLFRTGFIQNAMMNTDPRDAKAVLEVHGREISRQIGSPLTVKVVLFSKWTS